MPDPKPVKRTLVVLEISHLKDLPHLAEMIAGRAWTLDGVCGVDIITNLETTRLQLAGFSMAEIALGASEVHRS